MKSRIKSNHFDTEKKVCGSSATKKNVWLNIYALALRLCIRPYVVKSTASRPICEVKPLSVCLVLRWVTTVEPHDVVYISFFFCIFAFFFAASSVVSTAHLKRRRTGVIFFCSLSLPLRYIHRFRNACSCVLCCVQYVCIPPVYEVYVLWAQHIPPFL